MHLFSSSQYFNPLDSPSPENAVTYEIKCQLSSRLKWIISSEDSHSDHRNFLQHIGRKCVIKITHNFFTIFWLTSQWKWGEKEGMKIINLPFLFSFFSKFIFVIERKQKKCIFIFLMKKYEKRTKINVWNEKNMNIDVMWSQDGWIMFVN